MEQVTMKNILLLEINLYFVFYFNCIIYFFQIIRITEYPTLNNHVEQMTMNAHKPISINFCDEGLYANNLYKHIELVAKYYKTCLVK